VTPWNQNYSRRSVFLFCTQGKSPSPAIGPSKAQERRKNPAVVSETLKRRRISFHAPDIHAGKVLIFSLWEFMVWWRESQKNFGGGK
jgi:hypothetical protein